MYLFLPKIPFDNPRKAGRYGSLFAQLFYTTVDMVIQEHRVSEANVRFPGRLNLTTRALLMLCVCMLWGTKALAVAGGEGESASLYVELGQPLVVNVFSQDSVHFVRATVQLKLTDPTLAPQVSLHLPAIRHSLIMFLSERALFEFQTTAGKRKIRDDALAAVRQVVKEQTGTAAIDSIFFTSLMLQ